MVSESRWFVDAAGVEGIASQDSEYGEYAAFDQAAGFNHFVTVLRAGGVEAAVTLWVKFTWYPVIKGERLLVQPDHLQHNVPGEIR